VVLSSLHYQVNNGGFRQWVDNGYAIDDFELLLKYLLRLGTANALLVHGLVSALHPYLNLQTVYRGFGSSPWRIEKQDSYSEEEAFEPEEFCYGWTIADKNDEIYYSLKNWVEEIENWLKAGIPSSPLIPIVPDLNQHYSLPSENGTRYPYIRVQLSGQNGNAFNLLGIVQKALRKHHIPEVEIKKFIDEATTSSYDHLLQVCHTWVEVR